MGCELNLVEGSMTVRTTRKVRTGTHTVWATGRRQPTRHVNSLGVSVVPSQKVAWSCRRQQQGPGCVNGAPHGHSSSVRIAKGFGLRSLPRARTHLTIL